MWGACALFAGFLLLLAATDLEMMSRLADSLDRRNRKHSAVATENTPTQSILRSWIEYLGHILRDPSLLEHQAVFGPAHSFKRLSSPSVEDSLEHIGTSSHLRIRGQEFNFLQRSRPPLYTNFLTRFGSPIPHTPYVLYSVRTPIVGT